MTTGKTNREPSTQAGAHIIWNNSGEVQKITLDDTEAAMAASENLTVTTNASAEELSEELANIPPRDVMDEETWLQIGPIITQNMMARMHEATKSSQDLTLDHDQDEGMTLG